MFQMKDSFFKGGLLSKIYQIKQFKDNQRAYSVGSNGKDGVYYMIDNIEVSGKYLHKYWNDIIILVMFIEPDIIENTPPVYHDQEEDTLYRQNLAPILSTEQEYEYDQYDQQEEFDYDTSTTTEFPTTTESNVRNVIQTNFMHFSPALESTSPPLLRQENSIPPNNCFFRNNINNCDIYLCRMGRNKSSLFVL